MKKTIKLMMMLLSVSALMFVSCSKDKDGKYVPGRKLKTVEVASVTTVGGTDITTVTQVSEFVWDGKMVSKINIKDGSGGDMGRLTFTYDKKKRVSEIYSESVDNSLYVFTYDGKDLVKVVEYDDKDDLDDIVSDYIFTKVDGKIVEITHTVYDDDKKATFSPLQLIMPEEIALAFESQSNTKSDEVSVLKLTWEGKNVVKTVMTSGGVASTNVMTYDDKVNPVKGLYTNSFYYSSEMYSANNILTDVVTLPIIGESTSEYVYEYDGDYPVKQTSTKEVAIIGTVKNVVTYTYE